MVKVLDINDGQPMIISSKENFTVVEGTAVGTSIGKLETFGIPAGSNMLFTVIDGNHGNLIDIDKSTGQLYVGQNIDYERSAVIELKVQAYDLNSNNPQSSVMDVEIHVKDTNDNAPQFTQIPVTFTVDESTSVGTTVYTFSVADPDSGLNGKVHLGITDSAPASGYFSINPATGELSVRKALDFETYQKFELFVTATDQAEYESERKSTTILATVFINDVNDHAPVFTTADTVHVMEDAPVEFIVLQILAVDGDSPANSRVTYGSLSPQIASDDAAFFLDRETGMRAHK